MDEWAAEGGDKVQLGTIRVRLTPGKEVTTDADGSTVVRSDANDGAVIPEHLAAWP